MKTQAEKLEEAYKLLSEVWSEISTGKKEEVLHTAADCQVLINRIVWKLNLKDEAVNLRAM